MQFVGAKVCFYLSNPGTLRSDLILESAEFAERNQAKIIITVDCGITAIKEIQAISSKGIDVIITDHHEPTEELPQCTAILNPKLSCDEYPNRHLTGVGVAFKLAHALTNRLVSKGKISPKKIDLKRYLDLVALGTVSDMGILMGENRILVRYGLQQLKRNRRVGLKELMKVSGITSQDISTTSISTKIAPRLNSLGRIADPTKGVELFLLKDREQAEMLALELNQNNMERQRIERSMAEDIEAMLAQDPALLEQKAIVLEAKSWHPGVIAILSTRLAKTYNRPTIVIAIDQGIGKDLFDQFLNFRSFQHSNKSLIYF